MLYFKNAKLIDQAIVSIEDRAFLYGDGCFTTARLKDGQILLWPRHLQRLEQAIFALSMNCDIDSIKRDIEAVLQQLGSAQNGVVKIILSRGVGQRGYAMPAQLADIYLFFYPSAPQQTPQPTLLHRVGIMQNALSTSMPVLKGIKSLNRLEQVVLKQQAIQQGWDEVLCLDLQHDVVEGISSNCFVEIDGQWCTPNLALAGIAGVMRQEILDRMKDYQIAHQIRIIKHNELSQITAGFFCNALHPMQIISQIQDDQMALKALNEQRCRQLFDILHLEELV